MRIHADLGHYHALFRVHCCLSSLSSSLSDLLDVLQEKPPLGIIILTMHDDEYYLRELFRIGVRGFVLKNSAHGDLLRAIRQVHRGQEFVDPSLAGRMLTDHYSQRRCSATARSELLTRREKEVCALLAYGHTNVEIADKLCISVRTVDTHRANITAKLESGSRAELVRFAIENNLLRLH